MSHAQGAEARDRVVSVSPEQARAMSPDEAKAILVARAAIESKAIELKEAAPEILGFRASRSQEGWSVFVQYVGGWNDGKPIPAPGYFSVVDLGADYSVKRITGGA